MNEPRLLSGDCRELMRDLADNSVDSIVTDPPYGIRFMGMAWDAPDIAALSAHRRGVEEKRSRPNDGRGLGHASAAAAAGVYDLTPSAMRAFQTFSEEWAREAFRVLKPGGHLLSFSSARTYHRMTAGIEDAGFEVRDQIMWVYGSGFPKSLDVSKAMDKAAGAEREIVGKVAGMGKQNPEWNGTAKGRAKDSFAPEYDLTVPATDLARQWQGWGTALKPAHEPIVVARKPLEGTVAANVAKWGTGALNIAKCRVPAGDNVKFERAPGNVSRENWRKGTCVGLAIAAGDRWPANLIHDGSDEVMDLFAAQSKRAGMHSAGKARSGSFGGDYDASSYDMSGPREMGRFGDTGTAARFFYCAKSSAADRNAGLPEGERSNHPTVKPTALMRYLCRLVTPPGGTILDPFMGSGSTGRGAVLEGFRFIGIDITEDYVTIARKRIADAAA